MSAELWLEPDPLDPDRDGRVSPGSPSAAEREAVTQVASVLPLA
jgi:hypothetical protein